MEFEHLKIEIRLLPGEIDLVKPTWSLFDSESGELIFPVTDELALQCMHSMMFCALSIKQALEYKKTVLELN